MCTMELTKTVIFITQRDILTFLWFISTADVWPVGLTLI